MPRRKVFGIGMFKTGTTSLGVALAQLGFRSSYRFWPLLPTLAPYFDLDTRKFAPFEDEIRSRADQFDAFADSPWLYLYKELDQWYPGSRFILTVRESSERLVASELNHWSRHGLTKRWIADEGYEVAPEQFARRYEEHNENVLAYFKDRPDDLLVICWETEPEPWSRLCRFLDVAEVPELPFPHENADPISRTGSPPHFRSELANHAARLDRPADDTPARERTVTLHLALSDGSKCSVSVATDAAVLTKMFALLAKPDCSQNPGDFVCLPTDDGHSEIRLTRESVVSIVSEPPVLVPSKARIES